MQPFDFLKYMVKEEHRALDELISDLHKEELDQPLLKSGEISIRDRLVHILSAEYSMSSYLFDEEDRVIDEKGETIKELLDMSSTSLERHHRTLDNLTMEDLNKDWHSKVSGNTYSYKFLLWHFIEHIATHRGQVVMAVRRIRSNKD